MKKTPALKIEYGNRIVLNVPELEFEEGKVYALIGANGSGKTTFGKNCGFSYQPQKPYAFRMTVLKNVLLGNNDSSQESVDKAKSLLKELKLEAFENARADKLSGGETAKMALARSIMAGQDAIVLDEPTNSMDIDGSILAENLIRRYADEGHVVVLITHSIRQAERISDKILFLKDGCLNDDPSAIKEFLDYYA